MEKFDRKFRASAAILLSLESLSVTFLIAVTPDLT